MWSMDELFPSTFLTNKKWNSSILKVRLHEYIYRIPRIDYSSTWKFSKKMKEKKSVVYSYWNTFLLDKGNKQCQ